MFKPKPKTEGTRHPMFANPHNEGQRTTGHRDVEKADAMVAKEGKHPEHGQFKPDFPVDKKGMPTGSPGTSHFASPKGTKVAITDHTRVQVMEKLTPGKLKSANQEQSPTDQKYTVKASDGSASTMSKPATKVYLQGRFGIRS